MNRYIRGWYRLVDRLTTWVGVFAGFCLGALVFLTTADVILRAALNAPIFGTVEITEFVIVFIALSWIAYAQAKKGHVVLDIVTERLPRGAQNFLYIVGCIFALCFAGLVVWRTIVQLYDISGQGRSTFLLHIPHEISLAFIIIGFFLYFLVTLNSILQAIGIGKVEESTDG